MLITHIGHACLLVETSGARVLLDPGSFSPAAAELTGLDAVLVTHGHADHVDPAVVGRLLGANPGARLVAEPGTAGDLTGSGLPCEPLASGDEVAVGGLSVRAVGGLHAVVHPEVPRVGNVGLLLSEGDGPVLFHPGDSYGTVPDGVDVLALPLQGPWCSLAETVDFLRAVAPAAAFPVHDAILSEIGRPVFLERVRALAGEIPVRDLAGAGPTDHGTLV